MLSEKVGSHFLSWFGKTCVTEPFSNGYVTPGEPKISVILLSVNEDSRYINVSRNGQELLIRVKSGNLVGLRNGLS